LIFLLPREARDLIRRWSEARGFLYMVPVVFKRQTAAQVVGERTSGAKALMSGGKCGTAEAVPFVETGFSREDPKNSPLCRPSGTRFA
jgi:hypothetical protein